jgi:hypothetical protein
MPDGNGAASHPWRIEYRAAEVGQGPNSEARMAMHQDDREAVRVHRRVEVEFATDHSRLGTYWGTARRARGARFGRTVDDEPGGVRAAPVGRKAQQARWAAASRGTT